MIIIKYIDGSSRFIETDSSFFLSTVVEGQRGVKQTITPADKALSLANDSGNVATVTLLKGSEQIFHKTFWLELAEKESEPTPIQKLASKMMMREEIKRMKKETKGQTLKLLVKAH